MKTRTAAMLVMIGLGLFLDCPASEATRQKGDNRSRQSVAGVVTPFGEIVRGPRGKWEIAITFDAGANAECFDDLITALETAHVRSTFFITGNFAQRHEPCAKAITKHGHELGNHTWNHADLTKQSDEIVREEIMRAEVLLTDITGQSPRPRLRAPFGERNERVLRIAENLGYRSIYWTLDSLDSVDPKKTPEFLIDRVTSRSDAELDGAIILMHVGEKSTADALPTIIADLQRRGFKLVTVSKLLEPRTANRQARNGESFARAAKRIRAAAASCSQKEKSHDYTRSPDPDAGSRPVLSTIRNSAAYDARQCLPRPQ